MADALLVRGPIHTLDPVCPQVDGLLMSRGRVVALGAGATGGASRVLQLKAGEMAMPAFADPHLHLLSAAAARVSVDCSGAASLAQVLERIAGAAAALPAGAWVRASGFDDALIVEKRYPTRAELDRAAQGRPLVVHHATGHAAVLSAAALAHIGADSTGDGILVDRHDLLARVPHMAEADLQAGLAAFVDDLARNGVVSVTDTTHTNDRAQLEYLDRALRAIDAPLTVSAMPGWDRLEGLAPGSRVGCVTVGPAKIMPVAGLCLAEAVAEVHRRGFSAAVHAVDFDTLEEVIAAFEQSPPPTGKHDRIEHCSLALPKQLDHLARLPVTVVTQPAFVARREAKYRRQLSAVEHPWLYPVAGLLARGVPVRFSSDAPVAPSQPLEWVAAARDRTLAPAEAVDTLTGLRLSSLGPLRPGGDARLVVLDAQQRVVRVIKGDGHDG